jgi:putative Holliday junction resolvase
MRYLGIEYGKKRIGLALSDEGGKLAFPQEIAQNDSYALGRIGKIVKEENVGEVVIGESLNSLGDPNKVMEEIKIFAKKLETEFYLPVRLQKEFFTSVEARRYQGTGAKAGVKAAARNTRRTVTKNSSKADAKAAALILQRYLDRMNNKKAQAYE